MRASQSGREVCARDFRYLEVSGKLQSSNSGANYLCYTVGHANFSGTDIACFTRVNDRITVVATPTFLAYAVPTAQIAAQELSTVLHVGKRARSGVPSKPLQP